MQRELVWVEKDDFHGWVCSECAWKFKPSGVPTGNTIYEMKQEFERQRDNEFASHLCREHPKREELNTFQKVQINRPSARANAQNY